MTTTINKQVSEVPLEESRVLNVPSKRARSSVERKTTDVVKNGQEEQEGDASAREEAPIIARDPSCQSNDTTDSSSGSGSGACTSAFHPLPPAAETPTTTTAAAAAVPSPSVSTCPPSQVLLQSWPDGSAAAPSAKYDNNISISTLRSASPTPSTASSSTFSAATTSATLSSRASLSSCRSSSVAWGGGSGGGGRASFRRGSGSGGGQGSAAPSRSYPRPGLTSSPAEGGGSGAGSGFLFPAPSSCAWDRDGRGFRWRSGGGGGGGRKGRSRGRESAREQQQQERERSSRRCWSGEKDYASEASVQESGGGTNSGYGSSSSGGSGSRRCSAGRFGTRKRSRSGSRERAPRGKTAGGGGVECLRCGEWCRGSRERKAITRTLPMEYWVRTPRCKAAKSKHIDFIDKVAYSREQFIEETVFTCPFTGAQQDTVLERNMFPYDVPTDIEHWTLWSRKDLTNAEMEAFVEKWASDKHPHAVEWECDNNEGDRSIDWFHVHVFFRLGCEDKTGVPRDPASVYDGPCRPRPSCDVAEGGTDGEDSEVSVCP